MFQNVVTLCTNFRVWYITSRRHVNFFIHGVIFWGRLWTMTLHSSIQCLFVVFGVLQNSSTVFSGKIFHLFKSNLLAFRRHVVRPVRATENIKCFAVHGDNFQQTTDKWLDWPWKTNKRQNSRDCKTVFERHKTNASKLRNTAMLME